MIHMKIENYNKETLRLHGITVIIFFEKLLLNFRELKIKMSVNRFVLCAGFI